MSPAPDVPAPPALPYLDLLTRQLAGLDAWHAAHREEQQAAGRLTREQRLDLSRRQEARSREHAALVARAELHLRGSGGMLRGPDAPRAVLVHRDVWLAKALGELLAARGVEVLAVVEDGAAAVGTVVAEQPDLVLIEDRLPTLTATEVVQRVRRFAPRAVLAVQYRDTADSLAEAGAHLLLPRRAPAEELVDALLAGLDRTPELVSAG